MYSVTGKYLSIAVFRIFLISATLSVGFVALATTNQFSVKSHSPKSLPADYNVSLTFLVVYSLVFLYVALSIGTASAYL